MPRTGEHANVFENHGADRRVSIFRFAIKKNANACHRLKTSREAIKKGILDRKLDRR
jgi:hypothetical protein